jgi:hypothetical protein
MKAFYASLDQGTAELPIPDPSASYIGTRARVAVYDGPDCAPYIEDVDLAPASDYIHALAARVYELARQRGGPIPYTVVREVAENLIHAGFAEPVVSVLDDGHTIRFTDQGPGIPDKRRALQPGFTTATSEMKTFIRGVGSGLPVVNEFLSGSGGSLSIEDNLGRGSVVTLRAVDSPAPPKEPASEARTPSLLADSRDQAAGPSLALEGFAAENPADAQPYLSTRQKHVLALVLEAGSAGPSIVSRELGVGLSTAYRDLASLEDLGLIQADGGKRTLTPRGLLFLGGNHDRSGSLPDSLTGR